MPGGGSENGVLTGLGGGDVFAGLGLGTYGFLAATGGNDTAAIAGLLTTFGSAGITGGADTFAGLAPITRGAAAVTEAPDIAAMLGWCIVASLGGAEHHDTLGGSGTFTSAGALGPASGSDALAGAGAFKATGALAGTAGSDSFAGSANNTFIARATLLAGGADTLAATGFYGPPGHLGGLERHDTLAASGAFATSAAMAAAGRSDTMFGGSSTLEYHIYSNTGAGDPINYGSVIATTGLLDWTSSPLSYPGTWRFGVRAFDPLTTLEESNLDASVTLILDASGNDITNRPKPPTGLRAFATAGGGIRAEWGYNTISPKPVPTGFHVYAGTGGVPYYGAPAATVSFGAAIGGTFVANLPGLTNGIVYTIGVRAYNGVAEEPNTSTVNVTADSTGPTAVIDLTAAAIV